MAKRVVKRYSEAFKRQVVAEFEDGARPRELQDKYGIGGQMTVLRWVRKYAHASLRHELLVIQRPDEQSAVSRLKKRVEALEAAVAQLTVEKMVLEATLAEAETMLGTDIKKNDARPSSKRAGKAV